MKIAKEDLKKYLGKKIHWSGWALGEIEYVIPLFIGNKFIIVNRDTGEEDFFMVDGKNGFWETYEEPKKKVKMWQALVCDGNYFETKMFFKNESEAIEYGEGKFIKLLPHTEIEVEV